VTGPASSTVDHIAVYSDTTGKVIKNSGVLVTGLKPYYSGTSLPGDTTGYNEGDLFLVVP